MELSYEELAVKSFNNSSSFGNLPGYDCRVCNNKGLIAFLHDGEMATKRCSCVKIRENIKNIKNSGLEDLINNCTFETFIKTEKWQEDICETALRYLNEKNSWMVISGQVGCGKTHICTAVVANLMQKGKTAKYMLWRDEINRLKAGINTDYSEKIVDYKKADVLYIDDLFKNGINEKPTEADIRIAFEIINYRYNIPEKITILSTEKSMQEIIDIDEALGSRILQRAKNYCIFIGRDKNKNYRLR